MGKLLPTVNARLLNDDYAVENLSLRFSGSLNSKMIEIFVQIYVYMYTVVEGMKRDCLVLSNNSDGQGVREGMNIVFKREILSRFIS